jgi:hypothetical protein
MGKRAFDLLLSAAAAAAAGAAAGGRGGVGPARLARPGAVPPAARGPRRRALHASTSSAPWWSTPAGLGLTVGEDARITRAGRWLRRTQARRTAAALDVLRGAMSLVGPRPEVPRYVAHYPAACASCCWRCAPASPTRPRWRCATRPSCWPPAATPSASTRAHPAGQAAGLGRLRAPGLALDRSPARGAHRATAAGALRAACPG